MDNESGTGLSEEAEAELINFLTIEAENAHDTELDDRRASAIAAYNGERYGDEIEGRSQVVTRDVSEVIDHMLTGILGTIMAGGKAVEFETEPQQVPGPPGPDGQPVMQEVNYGEQATKAIQYWFFRKQNGYRILHDTMKAALLEKTGIAKTYAEPRKAVERTVQVPAGMLDWTEAEPTLQGMPIVSAEPMDEMVDGLEPDPMALWNVTISEPQRPLVRDEAVPNEWFLVSPDTVDLDESPYVGQCTPKTLSQMVAMGYPIDRLKEIWDNAPGDTVVESARDSARSKTRQSIGQRRGAARQLWFYEEYPLYDLDGDGVAERLCVHRIGRHVLNIVTVDEQPYSGGSPIPMPHRFVGESVADKTMDIQRMRSVLWRQGFDSIYQSNAPRLLVPIEGVTDDTFDDLLEIRPGGLIRYAANAAPTPLVINDTSGTSFQASEMLQLERERRTGVTSQSQGLNPDVAKNDTATAFLGMQSNSDQIQLYVCRNLVEMILAPIFAKRYRLMRQHTAPFRMKIDGEYVEIDPAQWPEEVDVQINVGLGTGTKDQRIGYINQLLQVMQASIGGGLRIFGEKQVHNAVTQLIEDTGIGSPSRYVVDPDKLPPEEPQPDPEAVKAQTDGQVQMARDAQAHQQAMTRLQLQQQEQEASLSLKAQANAADVEAKREKTALDIELARDKASAEATLAQQKAQTEAALAADRQAFEIEQARKKLEFDMEQGRQRSAAQSDDDGIKNLRPGGSLSE